jgi:glutaredoxin
MLRFTALLLLALGLATAAQAQYRWTDANGRVHYGDTPPRDAKDVRPVSARSGQGAADGAQAALPFELRRAVDRSPVVLITGPDCAPCGAARDLLKNRGVPHTEKTVSTPADLDEMRRIAGSLRLPHLAIGGQAQSGFNPDVWSSLLDAAGYPRGSMLPRSFQWSAAEPLARAESPAPAATAGEAPGSAAQQTRAARSN